MKRTHLQRLTVSAVMLALSIALSFVKIWKMPMGGSVTLVSMLPVMLVGFACGRAYGLGTAFVYALFQLAQAVMQGDVFPYCQTFAILLVCILFDYLLPFTALGLASFFKDKRLGAFRDFGSLCGIALACVLRFVCHYITGVFVWGQWAPEGMSKWLYSLLYNGGYMLPELILTLAVAAILLNVKPMRKLIGLTN